MSSQGTPTWDVFILPLRRKVERGRPLSNYVNRAGLLALSGLFLVACNQPPAGKSEQVPDYPQQIRDWQQQRETGLRSPEGWLTLVGLFWLKPGENSIGSAPSSDFVLPKEAPDHLGSLRLSGQSVTFTNLAERNVQVNGKPATQPVTLSYDEAHPDIVNAGSVSFLIIKRGRKLGVRVKDSASPTLQHFTGTTFFPVDPQLHFPDAALVQDPKKIPILNVLGQTELQDSPGYVVFHYQSQEYHLRPIYEGKTLFFLFKDPTNKRTTYQAGRMLNTPLPKNGKVDLDFNRAYNPPCTFTPFATCPLAPQENTLLFPVNAGEMRYKHSVE